MTTYATIYLFSDEKWPLYASIANIIVRHKMNELITHGFEFISDMSKMSRFYGTSLLL